jgi:hypothetical protein
MVLFKLAFWLLALPFRIVFWAVGLALWLMTLPVRLVFGLLGLVGFGRLLQLAIVAGVGYFFYRLVNEPPDEMGPATSAPSTSELERVPST